MTRARPNLKQYADAAKRTARRARLRRWITPVIATTAAILIFTVGHYAPRPMRLPTPHTTVIAYTSTGVHVAFLDSAGEFRNAETGEQIAQIIKWEIP